MIPVLYNANETRFVDNGRGRLADCISCIVTEERNGIYEMEFQYPVTGIHFDELELGRIVAATHDDNGDVQPFVIYSRSVPDLKGVCRFNAHHISYRLSDVVVMPFTAGSCADALQAISDNSVNANPFTFWTDKSVTKDYTSSVPRQARNMLGGEENSILDVFGSGEYEFDKFDVKLHTHRGTDTSVEIRYSKNLTDLNQTLDESGCYNAVVPYWADTNGNLVTLPEEIVVYSGLDPGAQVNAIAYNLTQNFSEEPSEADLRQLATTKLAASNAWIPSDNLKVNFIQLWQTEEFKDYAALQRVRLCDTVLIYYPAVGINAIRQKVVKTVYNVLLGRYNSIELGSIQPSLGQAIKLDVMTEVPSTSMMDAAIQYATDLIRGGLGGYVVMTPGIDGYPQEILIMDSPDVSTAVNVWRFNQNGLGHSSTGYLGPFSDIAITQDGKINASMITTGILNANIITAGTISDGSGKNSWNLTSGQFTTKQGTLGDFTISNDGLLYSTTSSRLAINKTGLSSYNKANNHWFGAQLYNAALNLLFTNSSDISNIAVAYRFRVLNVSGNAMLEVYDETNSAIVARYYVGNSVPLTIYNSTKVQGDFTATGTKSRAVNTENYGERLLYAYETPTPLFGDIGEAIIDDDGLAYVDIDDIFSETIADKVEYQVVLQKEGEGDCWIADKAPRYFVISGTPGLKVAWELKAKQKGYQNIRLEYSESALDVYEYRPDMDLNDYITEQEELLYGNN